MLRGLIATIFFVISSSALAQSSSLRDFNGDGLIDGFDKYLQGKGGSVVPLPVRRFVLDLKGNSALDLNVEVKNVSFVESTSTGQVQWKVDYKKKGNTRARRCTPPPFNLQFDKKDSSGRKRPLFPASGVVTRVPYEYQKVRFVPDCEISFPEDDIVAPRVLFREYIIARTLLEFGVAAPEPLGFAEVYIKSSDQTIDPNKPYRFLILQSVTSEDDQLPFVRQHSLREPVAETGIGDDDCVLCNNFFSDGLTYVKTELSPNQAPLDIQSSLAYHLLEDLFPFSDRGVMFNERYARMASKDVWKILPYDFDSSFYCRTTEPLAKWWPLIRKLPINEKQNFGTFLKKMFVDNQTLYKILYSIEEYPWKSDVRQGRDHIRLAFSTFGKYFASSAVAGSLQTPSLQNVRSLQESMYRAVEDRATATGSCKMHQMQLDKLLKLKDAPLQQPSPSPVSSPGMDTEVSKVVPVIIKPNVQSIVSPGNLLDIVWRGGGVNRILLQDERGQNRLVRTVSNPLGNSTGKTLWHIPSSMVAGKYRVLLDQHGRLSAGEWFRIDSNSTKSAISIIDGCSGKIGRGVKIKFLNLPKLEGFIRPATVFFRDVRTGKLTWTLTIEPFGEGYFIISTSVLSAGTYQVGVLSVGEVVAWGAEQCVLTP